MPFRVVDLTPSKELPVDRTFNVASGNTDWIIYWSNIATDATGRDHAEAGQQLGPCRSARAMAIIHLAMFEAYNAIDRRYVSYLNIEENHYASPQVAIAQAAHDSIVALFPAQTALHNQLLNDYLEDIPENSLKTNGVTLGCLCASESLLLKINDGSNYVEQKMGIDYIPSGAVGEWDIDPISNVPIALGSLWPAVEPFVLTSSSQFRAVPFLDLTSAQYTTEFNEAKSLGQEVSLTRTAEQTEIGIFWAYDGRPSLCAPPRLFNQIVRKISIEQNLKLFELVRLLALVNIGMADAASASWDSKYFYKVWRPVTAIRNAHLDGNASTVVDPTWEPLGAPASNGNGPNFSPPFPAYISGHATFGGAIFQILRRFFGTNNIAFSFMSDEFNGETKDNQGNPRPIVERSYTNLSQPELENGESRIYLGIHFRSDSTQGIVVGNNVGNYVYDNIFQPL